MQGKRIQWEHVTYEYDHQEGMWVDPNEHEIDIDGSAHLEDDKYSEDYSENIFGNQNMRAIAITPFGGYDINDAFSPLKGYELWIGHTNFNVTNSISDKIENVEGIELFKPMTRYRFCVGVARLFSFSNVRRDIESALQINVEDSLSEEVLNLKKSLESKTNDWLIYVSPSGEYLASADFNGNHREVINKVLNNEEYKNGIILKGKHLSE